MLRQHFWLSSKVFPIYFWLFLAIFLLLSWETPLRPPVSELRPLHKSHFRAEITVLMVVYNKCHYLNRSLRSILKLRIDPARLQILCVDDGSTDTSVAVIRRFQKRDSRISLHLHPANLGTHVARITAVMLTATPFLAFLDPDDELVGAGLSVALETIESHDHDIVEFECQLSKKPSHGKIFHCWKDPPIDFANGSLLRNLFFSGGINCHLHRKVIRTSLYRKAIRSMSYSLRRTRILRYEDRLHYAFLVHSMTRGFEYIHVLGEKRYFGLKDSSMFETYQNRNQSIANLQFVQNLINETFRYWPRV
jgi:glycosyltransferase involved in cell wall biosynthesis